MSYANVTTALVETNVGGVGRVRLSGTFVHGCVRDRQGMVLAREVRD